jgi:hypothetical protein
VGGSKSFPTSSATFASSISTGSCATRRRPIAGPLPSVDFAGAAAAVLRGRWPSLSGTPTADQIETAYAAIKSKINLDNTSASRLVVRLRDESHNCWASAGLRGNAQTMLDAIERLRRPAPVNQVDRGC